MTARTTTSVTCLGCGCACDDLSVTVDSGKITEIDNACPVGKRWFGDGTAPDAVLYDGKAATLETALDAAAGVLAAARGRLLVYLGADLSTEAQREAIGLADLLRATLDTSISDHAAQGILAAQRRGRAAATLGEIRNRADVVVFWGIDPAEKYPRFRTRYAVNPIGTHVAAGRKDRTIVGVHVGKDRAPADADVAVELAAADEIGALALLRAAVLGKAPQDVAPAFAPLLPLVERLVKARYVALVFDADPGDAARGTFAAEGLIGLAQALNGPTRAAMITLRSGGNRAGAEAALTWQTGFPFAVDFSRGVPRYQPERRGAADVGTPRYAATLVVGAPASVPDITTKALDAKTTIAIGPRASEAAFRPAIAIDTGTAGIHEAGIGYRLDDVPLPLKAVIEGPRSAAQTLRSLAALVAKRVAGGAA